MSDPLAEREEKGPSVGEFFSKIGTLLVLVSSIDLLIIGFQTFSESSPSYQFDFGLLLFIGGGIIVLCFMSFFQNRIKYQLNAVVFAIFIIVILTLAIFIAPGKGMPVGP